LDNVAAERKGGGDRLLDRLRQSLGLALDAAGEAVPLPLSPSDGGHEATSAGDQSDIERRYGGHFVTSRTRISRPKAAMPRSVSNLNLYLPDNAHRYWHVVWPKNDVIA